MKRFFLILCLIACCVYSYSQSSCFNPPKYVCYKSHNPIKIDGEIYNGEWDNAPWSAYFVDIRGENYKPEPIFETRMKMLWDDENIYIAAEIIEPHLWANIRQRDTTIYWDNDFEVFIDPDGDTHNYFEFEMNALGTEFDLMMTKPYKHDGTFIIGFDFKNIKSAVKLYGTLNNANDIDEKWTVEIKIPFSAIVNYKVKANDQWRMNFSRVEWLKYDIVNGGYKKKKGCEGFGSEENWVWAPTGIVDIHVPEHWGFVQFCGKTNGNPDLDFIWNSDEDVKFALRKIWYLQRDYYDKKGYYANNLSLLNFINDKNLQIKMYPSGSFLKITAKAPNGKYWSLTSDSRVFEGK